MESLKTEANLKTYVMIFLILLIIMAGLYLISQKRFKEPYYYEVDDILTNPMVFDTKEVSINGTVNKSNCICTLAVCTEENPCCNTCSCILVFKGTSGKIILRDENQILSCTGDNCGQKCDIWPGEYVLNGTFSIAGGEYYLTMHST